MVSKGEKGEGEPRRGPVSALRTLADAWRWQLESKNDFVKENVRRVMEKIRMAGGGAERRFGDGDVSCSSLPRGVHGTDLVPRPGSAG